MSTPNYFSYHNNLKYATSIDKSGRTNVINIKDYFHLSRLKDSIYKEETLYNEYCVKNGERPEQISYDLYGTEAYYWIILQVNDIVDYYNEWPLSQVELNDFILKKYGGYEGAGETHHWETVETKDDNGKLVLPGKMYVNRGFTYEYRPNPLTPIYRVSFPAEVSNTIYEQRTNEEKSQIQVVDPTFISDIVRDVRNFAKNSQVSFSDYDISDTSY